MLPSCLLFLTCIILLNVSSTLLAGGGGGVCPDGTGDEMGPGLGA